MVVGGRGGGSAAVVAPRLLDVEGDHAGGVRAAAGTGAVGDTVEVAGPVADRH